MPEYIDREKLRDALYEADSILMRGLAILNQLPAADVVPVRHGRWIEYPECLGYEEAYSEDHIVCSACGMVFNLLDNCTETFNFCPNCGARMDGDGE